MSSIQPRGSRDISVFNDENVVRGLTPSRNPNAYKFKAVSVRENVDPKTQEITKIVYWTFESPGVNGFADSVPQEKKRDKTITIQKPSRWENIFRAIANWLDSIVGIKHLPIDPRCLDMKPNDIIRFPIADKDRILTELGLTSSVVASETMDDDTVFTIVHPKEATFVMRSVEDDQGRATQYKLKRVP